MTDSTLNLNENLTFSEELPKSGFLSFGENLQFSEQLNKEDTQILEETLQAQDGVTKGHLLVLLQDLPLSDQTIKNINLVNPLQNLILLSDQPMNTTKRTLDDNMAFTDGITNKFYLSGMETFLILIYRNGVALSVDENEVISFTVRKRINNVGEAIITFDNEPWKDYRTGDEIEIYWGSDIAPSKIFSGEVDEVKQVRVEDEPAIELHCRDWGKLLLEKKATLSYPKAGKGQNGVGDATVDDIGKDIVSEITSSNPTLADRKISTNNVESTPKTRTIDFVGEALLDCLQKLGHVSQRDFYIDKNKDLHFFDRGSRDSGLVVIPRELENYSYERRYDTIINHVKIYGKDNKPLPLATDNNPDPWSDSIADWESSSGAVFVDDIAVRAGDYSINNDKLGDSPLSLNLKYTFPELVDLTTKEAYKELKFAAKVVYGGSLTSFPKLATTFELIDSNDNKVQYPAEQSYDLLKTFEASSEGGATDDSATHTTSSTSYVTHSTIEVTCEANERIKLNYVRDIIRNTWYGIHGASKIEYRFGGSGGWTLIGGEQTTSPDPDEVLHTYSKDDENCVASASWYWIGALANADPPAYTRVRVDHVQCQMRAKDLTSCTLQFGLAYQGGPLDPINGMFTTFENKWKYCEVNNINIRYDPDKYIAFYVRVRGLYGATTCEKEFGAITYWGTTSEKTKTPSINVTGGLGEKLEVRFSYKTDSGGEIYSTNRRIEFIKSQQVVPENLSEITLPVGPDSEVEGKWKKEGSDFDWSKVSQFNISTSITWDGGNSEWARLIVDWLHFDKGRWLGEYEDVFSSAEPPTGYGERFIEIFDETCFSDTACETMAREYVLKYKDPMDTITDCVIDKAGIEFVEPGDNITIQIPELGSEEE